MRELVELFEPLAKIPVTNGMWDFDPHTIKILTEGLAGICYELTYNFPLFDINESLDQYPADFRKEIIDLLHSARGQNLGYNFEPTELHFFIETIVTHVLKLEAAKYTSYDTPKLELLIEITIAMIEIKIDHLTYYAQKSANPYYKYKPGPVERQLHLPGMEPRTAF
jgi:hypothetical protein